MMTKTKAIVKVHFKTTLPEEKLQAISSEDMPVLAEVPGLITKLYHDNPDTGYIGAVYLFENEAAADDYSRSPMITNLESRYKAIPETLHVERVRVFFGLTGKNTESNGQKVVSMPWKAITTEGSLEKMLEASARKAIVIFKNSTRCPVSRSVLRRLDALWKQDELSKVDFYLLDIISYRSLSDKIAEMFDVRHASPQLLILKNGACIYHASHMNINYEDIKERTEVFSESPVN